MPNITVNQDLCIDCKACQKVCPGRAINKNEAGWYLKPLRCIKCGHCVAVCPTGAMDHSLCPLSGMPPLEQMPVLAPETAETFLRSRRSIRSFRGKNIPREVVLQLLNVARFAPTGNNSQKISYLVIDQAEQLQKFTEHIITWMEIQQAERRPGHQYFTLFTKVYRHTKDDMILRGAPCLILALAPDEPNQRAACATALAYLELYATCLGLGTCWLGLALRCLDDNYAPLLEMLHLPQGQIVQGAVIAGYSKYKYQRLPERSPLQVAFLEGQS
jgi:nitroreductase/NAD-dependent dihydropyrimidine dehydrogenase PreA subunit